MRRRERFLRNFREARKYRSVPMQLIDLIIHKLKIKWLPICALTKTCLLQIWLVLLSWTLPSYHAQKTVSNLLGCRLRVRTPLST